MRNYAGYNYERGQWVPIGDARGQQLFGQKGEGVTGSQRPPGPRNRVSLGF